MANPGQLPEEYRSHLDKIVDQLEAEGLSEDDIKATVNDYKTKYALPAMMGMSPSKLDPNVESTGSRIVKSLPSSLLKSLPLPSGPEGNTSISSGEINPLTGHPVTTPPIQNPLQELFGGLWDKLKDPKEAVSQDPVGATAIPATILQSLFHPNTRTFAGGAAKAGAESIPQNLGLKAGLGIPAALIGEVAKGPETAAMAALAAGSIPVLKDMFKGGMSAVEKAKLSNALKTSMETWKGKGIKTPFGGSTDPGYSPPSGPAKVNINPETPTWNPKKINYQRATGTGPTSGPSYSAPKVELNSNGDNLADFMRRNPKVKVVRNPKTGKFEKVSTD